MPVQCMVQFGVKTHIHKKIVNVQVCGLVMISCKSLWNGWPNSIPMEIKSSTQLITLMLITMPVSLNVMLTTMDLLMNVKFMNVLSKLKMIGEKMLVHTTDKPNVLETIVQMIVLVLGVVKILLLTLLMLSNI